MVTRLLLALLLFLSACSFLPEQREHQSDLNSLAYSATATVVAARTEQVLERERQAHVQALARERTIRLGWTYLAIGGMICLLAVMAGTTVYYLDALNRRRRWIWPHNGELPVAARRLETGELDRLTTTALVEGHVTRRIVASERREERRQLIAGAGEIAGQIGACMAQREREG